MPMFYRSSTLLSLFALHCFWATKRRVWTFLPITPFQNPCRCSQLLAPQDFQLSFYFPGKTMSISSPKEDWVCPLSRHTTSGAVLSFLLLSWCGAILPWVTMLGHDAWSWWRWLTLQVTTEILQRKGNRQSTTDRWVQMDPQTRLPWN